MIIRKAEPRDARAMAAIQNEIIAIGGSTAYQATRSSETVLQDYIAGPEVVCCHLAEVNGVVIGFQAIGHWPTLPRDWGDIGTFVKAGLQAKGTGAALFSATKRAAVVAGIAVLNATIRADNTGGLAYYGKMGFVDWPHEPDWAFADGRVVGRVSRRFDFDATTGTRRDV